MMPKARRREQGTKAKLCLLRPNTMEGVFTKEAQFHSTSNGQQLVDEHVATCSAVPNCERNQTALTSQTT